LNNITKFEYCNKPVQSGSNNQSVIYISLDGREDRHIYNLHVPIGIKSELGTYLKPVLHLFDTSVDRQKVEKQKESKLCQSTDEKLV